MRISAACGSQPAAPGNATQATIAATTQRTETAPPTQLTGLPDTIAPATDQNLTPECLAGQADLIAAAAPGRYRACVKSGTTVTDRIAAPAVGTWEPLETSAATQVRIVDQQSGADRTVAAHLQASQPGTATISTRSGFTGDPSGPPSYDWMLSVTVSP